MRFAYGGLTATGSRSSASLEAALDRGIALTPCGGECGAPHYTAMLALREDSRLARHVTKLLGDSR